MTCDDGRRGAWSGDAIIWADGTRSSLASPHPGVIIGSYPQFGEGRFKNQIVVRSKDADSLHAAAAAVREMLAKILAAQGA